MAKSKSKSKSGLPRKHDYSPRIANRRAFHDYHVTDKLECGVQLMGSEVKSIRLGQVSLAEGFVRVDPNRLELQLIGVDIAMYPFAGAAQHEPRRVRKLLAHKREIRKYLQLTAGKGVTLIPLAMYFKDGRVKVEIGLGTGKREYDKRQDLKKRESDRDIRRAMTKKVL